MDSGVKKIQTEDKVARNIAKQLDIITRGSTGEIYARPKGGITYKKITESQLNMWIVDEYQQNEMVYTRTKKHMVIDFIKSNTFVSDKDLDSNGYLTVNNGILDFNKPFTRYKEVDNELKPYLSIYNPQPHQAYYPFMSLPVDYDPDATCPNIDKFIDDVFGKENSEIIYNFIGYLLLPHVRYQRALILVGAGKNGKTTFLDMLTRFLGIQNVSQIPLHLLDDKFEIINLRDKFACIVSDLPNKELKDTGNAKRVVTDEYLSGFIKNVQGNFMFKNRVKMLYSCNELPPTKDKTLAFYRRWVLILCDKVFRDDEIDHFILDKITTSEEMSGLLNRAIEGVARLKENNGFDNTEHEVKELWENKSNPVAQFIRANCIRKDGEEIQSTLLFNAINESRAKQRKPILDYRKIGYWLRQYGIMGIQKRHPEDTDSFGRPKWYTYYQNLKFRTKTTEQLDKEWVNNING